MAAYNKKSAEVGCCFIAGEHANTDQELRAEDYARVKVS